MRSRTELLLLVAGCGFLLFYGLGAFGLLGADEPRYAQVAREMLDRGDWVTPTLNGKPWLEKPPLYYWQAMVSYRVARVFSNGGDGVDERSARLPGAIDAAFMIAAIYFFLRQRNKWRDARARLSAAEAVSRNFRSGSELDAALITASCAGVIGFAHAASTDMPLTATFTIALLAWYAWYESERRIALAIFYLCLALGTLAKGPVAPVLAAVIVLLFAAVKRDWSVLLRTLWIPGIVLFFAVSLPWYVAVQMRNPDFFRVFILEHNLARFSSNVYHHPQPVWFYLPVFLLAAMPWTLWLIMAVVERLRLSWRERREAFTGAQAFASEKDSWSLYLLLWMVVPIVFFSASQSKLPGYILPAVPAAALLVSEYLAARRERNIKISWPLAAAHGILCGLLIFAALFAATSAATSAAFVAVNHHLIFSQGAYIAAAIATVFAVGIAIALILPAGPQLLRPLTMLAAIVSVAGVIRLAAPAIDATQSARPIAEIIRSYSRESFSHESFSFERVPVALYHVGRTKQYGLDFYLNRPTQTYDEGQVPGAAHLLLAAPNAEAGFSALIPGRKVSYLTSLPAQKLEIYWIGKK
ncbi:MAG: glycosyltransferase family 39 protein [Terriglobales bacterium]